MILIIALYLMYLSSETSEKKSHFKILKNQLEFIWDQEYIKWLLGKYKACVQLNIEDMRHREAFSKLQVPETWPTHRAMKLPTC